MTSTFNSRLAAIGFRLAGVRTPARGEGDTDLEHTLLEALGQCSADGRLASLMFSWMHVHAEHVIVEKLAKFSRAEPEVVAWLSAIAAYACEQGRHKWAKLVRRQAAPMCLFTEQVTRSAIRLKGAVPWLERQNLLVAEGSLRIRPDDVLSVAELAKANHQYCNRLLFGACWRADIITAIQGGAATATEIAKRIGCS